jgi:hypothetical protein
MKLLYQQLQFQQHLKGHNKQHQLQLHQQKKNKKIYKNIKCQHVSVGIFFTEKLAEISFGTISEKQQVIN